MSSCQMSVQPMIWDRLANVIRSNRKARTMPPISAGEAKERDEIDARRINIDQEKASKIIDS
jgi:hypothetical protein